MTEITDPMPNAPLLLKTLHHIEAHPEEWVQETWHCGTTACYAGHAVIIDGGEWYPHGSALLIARDDDPAEDVWHDPCGSTSVIQVAHRARHILGLTHEQAVRLFSYDNTLDDLRAEVYRLVGDYDALAEVTARAATAAIDDPEILPSAYADPALSPTEKRARWEGLKELLERLQNAEDPTTVLDREETGPDFDAETFVIELRKLVDSEVRYLIGAGR